jgi:heme-degrading monooxygenase HmoA
VGQARDSYLISTSVLYWKEGGTERFYEFGANAMGQVAESDGLVAYALGTDDGCRAGRTITIWESEEAMIGFVFSGAHGEAVAAFQDIADSGRKMHWQASASELELLDWDFSRQRLRDAGPSPVYQ